MELLPVEESAYYRWRRPRIGEIEPSRPSPAIGTRARAHPAHQVGPLQRRRGGAARDWHSWCWDGANRFHWGREVRPTSF